VPAQPFNSLVRSDNKIATGDLVTAVAPVNIAPLPSKAPRRRRQRCDPRGDALLR
jgi:hypothetical protein